MFLIKKYATISCYVSKVEYLLPYWIIKKVTLQKGQKLLPLAYFGDSGTIILQYNNIMLMLDKEELELFLKREVIVREK